MTANLFRMVARNLGRIPEQLRHFILVLAISATYDTIAGSFPSSAETDPNDFPDPCEEGGTNCGSDN